jgi:hypothetical protein
MGFHYEDDRIQFIDKGIVDILPDYCVPERDGSDMWSIYLDDTATDDYKELYDLFSTNRNLWGTV